MEGGVASQDELYIPINAGQNHWNFARINMAEKVVELWDSLGVRSSNDKFLRVAERFVKDVTGCEVTEGRTVAGQQWQQG